MANTLLTGSEDQRLLQIQKYWLNFEPISHIDYAVRSGLYSVPLGQNVAPELIVNSGSVASSSGSIIIEKEIHLFSDETEAFRFVTDLGLKNIASISEIEINNGIMGKTNLVEIHVINNPVIDLRMEFNDFSSREGFTVEPFLSASATDVSGANDRVDLEPVTRNVRFDNQKRLISDTYLKFFCLETDELIAQERGSSIISTGVSFKEDDFEDV